MTSKEREKEKKDPTKAMGKSLPLLTSMATMLNQEQKGQEQRRDSQGSVMDLLREIRQDIKNSEDSLCK